MLNKSHSEPISISRTAEVMAYSQSDAILQNHTPPKHSVIDFSSYLIQKPSPGEEVCVEKKTESSSKCVMKKHESVHSVCSTHGGITHQTFHSVSESKTSSQCHTSTTSAQMCRSSYEEQRRSSSDHQLVLHVNDKENRVDIRLAKRDSTVSVPYAKPHKTTKDSSFANQDSGIFLQPASVADEYYFRSNLSDKMSDYEDIWKNNYADPKAGSVQADILQHLQPHLVSPKDHMTGQALDNHCVKTYTEKCVSEKHMVKDLNVSLDKLSVAKESTSKKETIEISSSKCVSKTSKSAVNCCSELSSSCCASESVSVQRASPSRDSAHVIERLHSLSFDTIPEQESDLDSDPSDGCHSDNAGDDADTEDCEERLGPRITSVQTQTSPLWKLKSPPFGKSVSTNSLSTMRSPVYAEPFDAISPAEASQGQSRNAKKLRRRSAPAVGMARKRRLSTECNKMTPVKHEEENSASQTVIDVSDSKTDEEDVFQISLELVNGVKPSQGSGQRTSPYELAWVDSKLCSQSPEREISSDKPVPLPRKTKAANNLLLTAVNNQRNMNEAAAIKIEKWRQENHLSKSCFSFDSMKFFEEFDENHNPSSPTLSKFPVFHRHMSDDPKLYTEGSTAEDFITSWNPELTLRPTHPFPIYGPQSEYDNLNSTGTPYIAPSGQSINSAGTVFLPPWEHSMVAKIMHISTPVGNPTTSNVSPAPSHAPPPLPPLDPHERIKAWQQSSQKYAPCVPVNMDDQDEDNDAAMVTDPSTEEQDVNSSSHKAQVGSGVTRGQDVRAVNGVGGSHSGTVTEKNSDNILIYGSEFQERIAPVLGRLCFTKFVIIGYKVSF